MATGERPSSERALTSGKMKLGLERLANDTNRSIQTRDARINNLFAWRQEAFRDYAPWEAARQHAVLTATAITAVQYSGSAFELAPAPKRKETQEEIDARLNAERRLGLTLSDPIVEALRLYILASADQAMTMQVADIPLDDRKKLFEAYQATMGKQMSGNRLLLLPEDYTGEERPEVVARLDREGRQIATAALRSALLVGGDDRLKQVRESQRVIQDAVRRGLSATPGLKIATLEEGRNEIVEPLTLPIELVAA